MNSSSGAALIAVDWGTTSARAYLLNAAGEIRDTHEAPLGIQNVRDGAFASALSSLLGPWAQDTAPRIACGMIGSRQGWLEAPYADCPAGIEAFAHSLVRTPDRSLAIIPGLRCAGTFGAPDVMRGEETEIIGALPDDAAARLVLLPGTHSKWAIVRAGRVETFATFMTGEVYAVLRDHSILGRLMQARDTPMREDAFLRGAAASDGTEMPPGILLHRLFNARTLALFGRLDAEDIADYLSGLLIGSEIAAGREWARACGIAQDAVTIVGASALCRRYAVALSRVGVAFDEAPRGAAARGMWKIALRAGVVR